MSNSSNILPIRITILFIYNASIRGYSGSMLERVSLKQLYDYVC